VWIFKGEVFNTQEQPPEAADGQAAAEATA
jgi:hypothetical protein